MVLMMFLACTFHNLSEINPESSLILSNVDRRLKVLRKLEAGFGSTLLEKSLEPGFWEAFGVRFRTQAAWDPKRIDYDDGYTSITAIV